MYCYCMCAGLQAWEHWAELPALPEYPLHKPWLECNQPCQRAYQGATDKWLILPSLWTVCDRLLVLLMGGLGDTQLYWWGKALQFRRYPQLTLCLQKILKRILEVENTISLLVSPWNQYFITNVIIVSDCPDIIHNHFSSYRYLSSVPFSVGAIISEGVLWRCSSVLPLVVHVHPRGGKGTRLLRGLLWSLCCRWPRGPIPHYRWWVLNCCRKWQRCLLETVLEMSPNLVLPPSNRKPLPAAWCRTSCPSWRTSWRC